MTTRCPVVHFEMPYRDPERMKTFYTAAFGWDHIQYGPEMGNYIVAQTSDSDNGRPTTPGAINGGFFPRGDQNPTNAPSVVIAVQDIDAAIETVKKAGGKVLSDPMEIPGVGMYAPFTDTEGNTLSMLQPLMAG